MVTGDGRPCNFQCWKLPWEPTTLIPRWWQLKDFWNFHPEIWGNDPIWRTFLKGVGSTTNQLFSWFWGPRVGDETSNMFFMFTRILWKMKPFWRPHIFQVGCSCSYRTLKLLVDRKWFGAGVFKKKETALWNLEKWWWKELIYQISKEYGKESAKCFLGKLETSWDPK